MPFLLAWLDLFIRMVAGACGALVLCVAAVVGLLMLFADPRDWRLWGGILLAAAAVGSLLLTLADRGVFG